MPAISQFDFLQSLGWALINSLWQMALLWVIYNVLLSFFTQIKPGKKAAMATLLITVGFGWFLFTFLNSLFFNSANDFYNKWSGLIRENAWNVFVQRVLALGSAIYLFILALHVWKFIRNYHYVQVIRHKGLTKIKAEWRIFVKKTAANMGIVRKVQIWLSDMVQTPVTIGYLKPVILIPFAAINHLSTQQVESIILHELSHIRRYDYLFNLIINFIKTILYFNPFVKLFVKTIERERENSCDEMVLQFPYQPSEYATALLLLEKNQHQQMMMAAAGKDHDLLNRIEAILGIRRKTNYSFRKLSVSFLTLLGIAFMNILFSVNSNKELTGFLTLNGEVSPYYFFNNRQDQTQKNTAAFFADRNTKKKNNFSNPIASTNQDLVRHPALSDYKYVNFTTPIIPELAKPEELKLKETIGATKRILEEKEWKEIENSYAEVFNSVEKVKLKDEYQKEVNKIDWNKLETQLRLSYDHIDWNKVNDQVANSLAQIKLDSIQQQVKLTLNNLISLETLLKENKTTSIPDTDVSLELIKENQQKAKAQLDKIKAVRNKKIVRL